MRTSRTVAAAAVLVLAAVVVPTSSARSEETTPPPAGAPVTTTDRVTVAADGAAEIDVLANDVDPDDPTGDQLDICRLEPSGDVPIHVVSSRSFDETDVDTGGHPVLFVDGSDARPGTYTVDYYVCDYDYLAPATLTVTVTAPRNPYARVLKRRPGYVRFHNPRKRRAIVQYGSVDGRTVDGEFALPARTARTVRIERRAIRWTATIRTRHGESSFGNLLQGVEQPARSSQPAHTGPGARTRADSTAWRRDESTDAPLTVPDAAEVSQGFLSFVDVLDNDSDPGGAEDDLRICRTSAPAGSHLELTPVPSGGGFIFYAEKRIPSTTTKSVGDLPSYSLVVHASRRTPVGTYDVTYWACDRQYLTPGTLTVTVTKSQMVTARKVSGRPALVRFTNPGPYGAWVRVEAFDEPRHELSGHPSVIARFRLAAGASRTIRPGIRRISWTASSRRGPGGGGVVLGIGRGPRGS